MKMTHSVKDGIPTWSVGTSWSILLSALRDTVVIHSGLVAAEGRVVRKQGLSCEVGVRARLLDILSYATGSRSR